MIVRPLFKSMTQPLFRLLSGSASLITRNFINLLGDPPQAYYELATPWVAAGDFEIEVDFSTVSAANQTLCGRSQGTSTLVVLLSSGVIRTRFNGSTIDSSVVSVRDGRLHHFKITSVGTAITVLLDNVSIATGTASGSVNIDNIGTYSSGLLFFEGIISNVKLTDITTPANSLPFGLDELTQDYEYPTGNVFGPELAPANAAGWTSQNGAILSDIEGGISIENNPTFGTAQLYLTASVGDTFVLNLNLQSADSQTVVNNVDTDLGATTLALGDNRLVFTITGASPSIRVLLNSTNSGDVSELISISLQQVTNVLNYRNIALDVRETLTLTDGDWLGDELVTNGDFANGLTGWSAGANGAISNLANTLVVTDSGGAYGRAVTPLVFAAGNTYTVSFEIVSLTTSIARFGVTNNSNGAAETSLLDISVAGVQAFPYAASLSTNYVTLLNQDGVSGRESVWDNVSVKRLIEVA